MKSNTSLILPLSLVAPFSRFYSFFTPPHLANAFLHPLLIIISTKMLRTSLFISVSCHSSSDTMNCVIHHQDTSLDDHQPSTSQLFKSRIFHKWSPWAIKHINLSCRTFSKGSNLTCTSLFPNLQSQNHLWQKLICNLRIIFDKNLPLPITSVSYLTVATCIFMTLHQLHLIFDY